jgi:plastocyanin
MNRKLIFIGQLILSLGFLGITTQATAALVDVSINPGAEACAFNNTGTCAYTPNPVTINSGDSVRWMNPPGAAPHTATSDALGNALVLTPPVGPANDFSTEVLLAGEFSSNIGFFITAVNQTKTYHCSLHPTTMGGTLIILATTSGTTTSTTTITGPTTPTTTTTIIGATTTTTTTTTTSTTIKVKICHKGKKTLNISNISVPDHLGHGDTLGVCP